MKCITCHKTCDLQRTAIQKGKLVTGCEQCLVSNIQQGDSAKYYREAQKREFRRELTQPWQAEYAKAYPEQARQEWGDELYRKHG